MTNAVMRAASGEFRDNSVSKEERKPVGRELPFRQAGWTWEQIDAKLGESDRLAVIREGEGPDPVAEYLDRLKSTEVRVTDAGGSQKGQKASQIAAMDPLALLYLGEVSGMGATKYAAFNYLQSGYDWRLSMDAALRHLLAFWAGQDSDSESELLHVAHAAWHCLALVSFQLREIGTDTRFKQ